jgi:23S rRNA pseudouridine1911/1915/1917 synthase
MMRDLKTILIPEGIEDERVDSVLANLLGLSRASVEKLLNAGEVKLGKKSLAKSDRVHTGQIVDVLLPEPASSEAIPKTPLNDLKIVFEDDDLVVVNKPVGCASHPSPGWAGPTVIGALIASGHTITTSGPPERTGIVHRLDATTSGLMIVAKSERAYHVLKDKFRDRDVVKIYHALAQGHIEPAEGTIDAPIDRHPKDAHKFAVTKEGKKSITHYEVIEYFRGCTLLNIELETGRTHQIRVHFSAIRHPLVGDTIYGADPKFAKEIGITRPWLHALSFEAEYPSDLTDCLSRLRA